MEIYFKDIDKGEISLYDVDNDMKNIDVYDRLLMKVFAYKFLWRCNVNG